MRKIVKSPAEKASIRAREGGGLRNLFRNRMRTFFFFCRSALKTTKKPNRPPSRRHRTKFGFTFRRTPQHCAVRSGAGGAALTHCRGPWKEAQFDRGRYRLLARPPLARSRRCRSVGCGKSRFAAAVFTMRVCIGLWSYVPSPPLSPPHLVSRLSLVPLSHEVGVRRRNGGEGTTDAHLWHCKVAEGGGGNCEGRGSRRLSAAATRPSYVSRVPSRYFSLVSPVRIDTSSPGRCRSRSRPSRRPSRPPAGRPSIHRPDRRLAGQVRSPTSGHQHRSATAFRG